ncbi:MAG: flagellar basal body-associated FliL family protein [Mycobacteriales bacterium]
MATTTKKAAAKPAEEGAQQASGGGRKKLLLIAVPLVALAAGWYFLLGPGAGDAGGEEAVAKKPEAGEVLSLEPITMNLADGRLLKVGLALQVVAKPSSGHGVTGAVALDEAIAFLGGRTYAELASPTARQAAKDELSKRVAERYHHDVMEVYFTEFVMQ